MKKVLLTLMLAAMLLSSKSWSQTPGMIFKPAGTGKIVLDPNGDGYSSASTAGFITSDQNESEIPYKPISIPNMEPNSDLSTGPDCSFGDIVDSGVEDPVFSYLDANQNLLFRFRLGGTANNTKGYSILIDADQKFGMTGATADLNAVAGNPGFEFEIVLRTNFGVSLYDIDGTTSSVLKTTLAYDNYAQKSIALSLSCGDADYFYDFYIPFSVITGYFSGITTSTPLRMVAVTTSNASSAIGNNAISDVSGVNDEGYGYNLENMFTSVINNFYPTPASSFNGGFPADLSTCPTINNNLNVNSSIISGTSSEANSTLIKLYKNSTLLGSTTVSSGAWSFNVSGLAHADVITATATASGKTESFSNCSPVTVAASCSPEVTINSSNTNTKNIGGTGTPGAIIKVYQNGVLIAANPSSSATIDGTGTFCWKTNGNTGACNGGAGTLSGSYKITQTVSGQCESKGVYVCVGSTTQTTAPVISTSVILTTTSSVSGTSLSGARVILFADGVEIGSTTADATTPFTWTISGMTFLSGQVITAKAISGTNCISNASGSKLVAFVSAAPVIFGTYCTLSTVASVSGSSSEAAGTSIEVFANGSSVGTTTTITGGGWIKSGLSLSAGTVITAKATATGKTTSTVSNSVTIGVLSNNFGLSVSSPLVEAGAAVSGSLSGAGTVKVYIDGSLLGTAVVSGSTWSLTGLSSLDLYAGGEVKATITSGSNCESTMSAGVVVNCITPDQSIMFTASANALCAGATTSITLSTSQSGVVYQLYRGATAAGLSMLGTGSAITLTSSPLLSSATLNVKTIKISPTSCSSLLSQQLAVTVTDLISSNSLTAPGTTVFCSAGNPASISGSTPSGGNGTYTYQWQQSSDNNTFTHIDAATLQDYDPNVITASTYYRRIVTSGSCSVTSPAVFITIQITDLTNSITAPSVINFCKQGDPDILSGDLPTGGTGSYTYQWQSSIDNIAYANINGATGQHYNPDAVDQNIYLRRLVSSGGCHDYPSNVIKIAVASTATSLITVSSSSLIANGSSTVTITIQVKDASGNSVIGSCAPVLSTTSGTLSSVTDQGNGSYTATYTASTTSGTATITGTLNGFQIDDTANISLLPGGVDASKTIITPASSAISADGISSTTLTIQLKDTHGNNLQTGGEVINLSTTRGTLSSVTDHDDGTYTVTLTSATSAGMAVISGTVDGNLMVTTASVNFIISSASSTQSTISSSAGTLTADGVSTALITVQLKDENGNNLTSGGNSIVLSVSLGTLGVVVDNNDGTYTALLTAATSLGTADVTGTLNGVSMTNQASIQFVPGAASSETSTITASSSSILANSTDVTVVTVQLKDAEGNNLSSGGNIIVLNSTLGSFSPVTDNLDGTYTATFTSGIVTGIAIITGTLDGNLITENEFVQLIPGAASAATSTLAAADLSIIANGISTSIITIQMNDAHGNKLVSGGDVLVLQTSGGTLSIITDNGDGTYRVTLTSSTTAGTAVITGTLNGVNVVDDEVIQLIPGPASVSASTISTTSLSMVADGLSTAVITVQLHDANGNKLTTGGDAVTVVSSLGITSSVTDHQDGTYTLTLTSATQTGTALITGTLSGVEIMDNKSVIFRPGEADAASSEITVSSPSIVANGASTVMIKVQLKDVNGNNLTQGQGNVMLATTLGALSSMSDHQDGTYTAILTSAQTTGTATITGTLQNASIAATATVQFVAGPASGETSLILISASSVEANGTGAVTITIQLKDIHGNSITMGGDQVVLTTTLGSLSAIVDQGDGTYSAVLTTGTTAGSALITGMVNGITINDNAVVQFTSPPINISPSNSVITASASSMIANGTSSVIITVQLKDTNGNNITNGGEVIQLTTTVGTLSAVVDHGNGTYTATLTATTTMGTALVSGKVNDFAIGNDVSVQLIAGDVSTLHSTLSVSSYAILSDNFSFIEITVQLKDAFGNNLTSNANAVNLTTSLGAITPVYYIGNGKYYAKLMSNNTIGSATLKGYIDGVAMASPLTITFYNPTVYIATITSEKNELPADGSSFTTLSISVKNQMDDFISDAAVMVETTAGSVAAVENLGNGNYRTTLTAATVAQSAHINFSVNGARQAAYLIIAFVEVPIEALFIPEGFSPDGDGVNDTFVIYHAPTDHIALKIFDRWGNLVFENMNYDNEWNGFANHGIMIGERLPDGTYFYSMDLHDGNKPYVRYLTLKRSK